MSKIIWYLGIGLLIGMFGCIPNSQNLSQSVTTTVTTPLIDDGMKQVAIRNMGPGHQMAQAQ